VRELATDCKIQ